MLSGGCVQGQIPIIIRNTPNVLGFLGDTKEDSRKMNATPLRPQEVARILGRVDEMNAQGGGERNTLLCRRDRQGYGRSFLELPGYYRGSRQRGAKKLTVSVKIFGRKTPMELSFTQVEKNN